MITSVIISDYECVSVHAWTGVFVCPEHKAPRYEFMIRKYANVYSYNLLL